MSPPLRVGPAQARSLPAEQANEFASRRSREAVKGYAGRALALGMRNPPAGAPEARGRHASLTRLP